MRAQIKIPLLFYFILICSMTYHFLGDLNNNLHGSTWILSSISLCLTFLRIATKLCFAIQCYLFNLKTEISGFPPEHPPAEIWTSKTILSGLWKGKGLAARWATAFIISSQSCSRDAGSFTWRRSGVGAVRMMLSVASSPHGTSFFSVSFFQSSWDVLPGVRNRQPVPYHSSPLPTVAFVRSPIKKNLVMNQSLFLLWSETNPWPFPSSSQVSPDSMFIAQPTFTLVVHPLLPLDSQPPSNHCSISL